MYSLLKSDMPSKQPMDWTKPAGLKRHWSFLQEIFVLFFAIRDLRTPLYAKLTAFFALLYLVSPLDFIPDFIPVAGYLDDLVIVPLLLHISFRLLPAPVREESWIKAGKQAARIRI